MRPPLRRIAILLAVSSCSAGQIDPAAHETTQPISDTATATVPAGSLGLDDSRFFPIGLWYDSGLRFNGMTPSWPYETSLFYDETLRQVKSWGVNTIKNVTLEADSTGFPDVKGLLDAAARVGGINVILGGVPYLDVTSTEPHLAPLFSHPALLAYELADEPTAAELPNVRAMRTWLDVADPAHDGFGSNDWQPPSASQNAYWNVTDAATGYNTFTSDLYTITKGMAATDPIALTWWTGQLDQIWAATPLDKPWWQVIQVFGDAMYRMPDRIEQRYMTYTALAHGAKGIFFFLETPSVDPYLQAGIVDASFDLTNGGGAVVPALAHELAALAPAIVDATRDDPRTGRVGGQGCGAGATSPVAAFVGGRTVADCDLFTHTTSANEKIVTLVNKHRTPQVFDLFLNKAQLDMAQGTPSLVDAGTGAVVALHDNGAQLEVLYPVDAGNGAVLRVVPPFAARIDLVRDYELHATTLGRAARVRATVTNTGTSAWQPGTIAPVVNVYGPGGTVVAATNVRESFGLLSSQVVNPGDRLPVMVIVPTGSGTQIAANGSYSLGVDLARGGVAFGEERRVTMFVHDDPLFFDTFDPPTYKHAPPFLANWDRAPLATIREGALVLDGHGATMSHVGDAWSDYLVEFDVKIDAVPKSQHAAWVVRGNSTNGGNGTVFRLNAGSPGAIQIYSLQNGQLVSANALISLARAITPGTWIHVKLNVWGPIVTTWLDGQMVNQSQFALAPSGKVGFYASESDGDRAHVDNVVVYKDNVSAPAPAAPTNLAAAPSSGVVQLTWTPSASSGVAYYLVYGSATPGGPYDPLAGRTNPVLAYYPASPTYFVVTAVSVNGVESPPSNEVLAAPPASLGTPASLSASAQSQSSVQLVWQPASGPVDHYDVYRVAGAAPASWGESARIASVPATSYLDDAATLFVSDQQVAPRPFGAYTYAVQAVDASGGRGGVVIASATLPGSSVFSDGFDASTPSWQPIAGAWSMNGSSYAQSATWSCGAYTGLAVTHAGDDARFGDFVVDVQVRIDDNGGNDSNWAGLGFRRNTPHDGFNQSGYLLYYRASGELNLFAAGRGTLVTALGAPSPKGAYHALRVEMHGTHILAYVDGVKLIDFVDPQPSAIAANGYFTLDTCDVGARYDSFDVTYREEMNSLEGLTVVGTASAQFGQLTLSGTSAVTPSHTLVRDFTAELDVKIDADTGGGWGWAGLTFRKTAETDRYWQSGYLLYYRSNGQLLLYRSNTNLAAVSTGVLPTSATQKLKVVAHGPNIQVYLDGMLELSVVDGTYAAGYLDLSVYSATTRFDALEVD